jgi:hypothetical protein
MSSLDVSDQEAAAIATGPRVSVASLKSKIKARHIFTADQVPNGPDEPELKILTVCICVLENGWTLLGKSAPAAPENFDAALGAKFAFEDCIRQMWPLEGYALRERLHTVGAGAVKS